MLTSTRGWLSALLFAPSIGCLGACTTVTIHNADVVTTSHLGIVALQVKPDRERASIVVTDGIGLTLGVRSATLGYLGETVFLAPDAGACRAFIFVNDRAQLEELRSFFERQPQLAQICVVRKEGPPP